MEKAKPIKKIAPKGGNRGGIDNYRDAAAVEAVTGESPAMNASENR